MAGFRLLLFVILAKSARSNECAASQEISCENLRSSHGYTYTVPPGILCSENCEQGWYYQKGTFIVDSSPNASGRRLPVVVDVTPQNLTLSVCENLQWHLDCGKLQCNCIINYTVAGDTLSNNTSVNKEDDNHDGNGLPGWGIVLIVVVAVGAFITILFIGKMANCFRE